MAEHPILRWLLPVSLTVNAFLGGLMVSQWQKPAVPPPPRPERMIEEMAETLPAADAAILRQSFGARTAKLEHRPRNPEEMFLKIGAALKTEPFDPLALAAIFRDGRKSRDAMDDTIEGALVDAATKMSAEGRHKLADWHPRPPRD
ncbi:MAG: periplasmic heavy metal sensor [Magnetospirillum sp.]|nr:periplasmic heavy metal sensor [Magnetospirillum sp.]